MPSPVSHQKSPNKSQPDTESALFAVRDMTQSDSSDLMRRRFAENLASLFSLVSINFLTPTAANRLNITLRCEIIQDGGKPNFNWDNKPSRGVIAQGALARAMTEHTPQVPSDDPYVDYFPICVERKVLEVIEVRRSPLLSNNRESMSHVLAIYSNFVRILHFQELDALTGALNRGAFDNKISITTQAMRQKTDFSPDPAHWWLFMVDVDHFKRINDNFGHLIGDEVLLLITRIMQATVRAVDTVYRYGGEEFAILVSPCKRVDASNLAERMRSKIASAHFPQIEHITVSIGMAPIDRFDHAANIIGRADQALYKAKREGRNRVCMHQESITSLHPGLQAPGALELFN
ncbi:MAG: GGDEF domain-containing protein [Oceanococcus sp.]